MKIQARFSGLIAASLGSKEKVIEAPDGATIKDVLDLIALPVNRSWTVTSVNGVVKDKAAVLQDGDVLYVVPVGGGG